MITILTPSGDGVAQSSNPADLIGLLEAKTPFWLDLGAPAEADFKLLADVFKFHPLALEDAGRPHQRPKVDEYDGYFFMAADEAHYNATPDDPTDDEVQSRQIAIFLGATYMVTVDTAGSDAIASLRGRCLRHSQMLQHGPDRLLHTLLDTIVDGYFPILDSFDTSIDTLEDSVMATPEPGMLPKIFAMKRSLAQLRRMAGPLREAVQTLTTRNFPHIQDSTIPYLRDVTDHLFRVYETLDSYRDLMSNMLDAYLTQVNNGMSRVMQRLSAVTLIFMPITFLTGVFGMNFAKQPWADQSVWFWLLVMGAIAAAMALWLRLRRWF